MSRPWVWSLTLLQARALLSTSVPHRLVALEAVRDSRTQTSDKVGVFDRKSWEAGYANASREELGRVVCVDGLPAELRGTYFRNGPTRFVVGSCRVLHPFDADGMVTAITLSGDGRALVRYRYVRTKAFVDESAEGRLIFSGTFGNPRPIWRGLPANRANTNVLPVDGRVLALWEQGLPYELDPTSLETLGERRIDDLPSITAHPRLLAGRTTAFSYTPVPLAGTTIDVFDLDDALRVSNRRRVRLPGIFGLFHDFAATDSCAVFSAAPTTFQWSSAAEVALGRRAVGHCIAFDKSRPSQFVVVPRDPSQSVLTIPTEAHFSFHFANAFDDPVDGRVVVDSVVSEDFDLYDVGEEPVWQAADISKIPLATLWRYRLDLASRKVVDRYQVCDRFLEFPVVDRRFAGKPYRFVWGSTGAATTAFSPPQGIIKIDLHGDCAPIVWLPEPHQFAGEPCFVPRNQEAPEGDGFLLTILFDAHQRESKLLVFDAADLSLISSVPLGAALPHGLHGTFLADIGPPS